MVISREILVVEAEGMEVIKEVAVDREELEVVLTKAVETTGLVVALMLVVQCRATIHKEVDITRDGVISSNKVSSRSSSNNNNKAGASNKDGVIRVNSKPGEHRAMDSGVMVNSRQQLIQPSRPRAITGELTTLVHGQTGARITRRNNINSGTDSRLDSIINRLVLVLVLAPVQVAPREPATLDHKHSCRDVNIMIYFSMNML